jgi:Flp pilus assembly pilin Flp
MVQDETVLKPPPWFKPHRRLPVHVSASQHSGFGMQQLKLSTVQKREPYMLEFIKTWVELKTDRRAVTALEYALIAGVIVATVLVGFNVLAGDMSNKFNSIGAAI